MILAVSRSACILVLCTRESTHVCLGTRDDVMGELVDTIFLVRGEERYASSKSYLAGLSDHSDLWTRVTIGTV